jgi:hypothetical protein
MCACCQFFCCCCCEPPIGERNPEFSFASLMEDEDRKTESYRSYRAGSFIYLEIINFDKTQLGEHGWKFHISIDDTNRENLARGWNIVKDVLIANNITKFKIYAPESGKSMESGSNPSKQITIYAYYDLEEKNAEDWQRIIREVTLHLANEGVHPAGKPKNDRLIKGSSFVSYRNDADAEGGYSSSEEHNPRALPDPFAGITVNYVMQLPRKNANSAATEESSSRKPSLLVMS